MTGQSRLGHLVTVLRVSSTSDSASGSPAKAPLGWFAECAEVVDVAVAWSYLPGGELVAGAQ